MTPAQANEVVLILRRLSMQLFGIAILLCSILATLAIGFMK